MKEEKNIEDILFSVVDWMSGWESLDQRGRGGPIYTQKSIMNHEYSRMTFQCGSGSGSYEETILSRRYLLYLVGRRRD